MVHKDYRNKQEANWQERNNKVLLLLYHLDLQSHLDLISLNHLNVLIHLWAIKRIILELQWNLEFVLSEPLNQLSKKTWYMGIRHWPKSNNTYGQNMILYERYLGKDIRNSWILYHCNLQIQDLKIEIFPCWETEARRSLIAWLRKLSYLHSFLNYWLIRIFGCAEILPQY